MLNIFYSWVASSAWIINSAILYNKCSVIFSVKHLVLDGTHTTSISRKNPLQVNQMFDAILSTYCWVNAHGCFQWSAFPYLLPLSSSVAWCPMPGTDWLPDTPEALLFVQNSKWGRGAFLCLCQHAGKAYCPPYPSPIEPPTYWWLCWGEGIFTARWSPGLS